MKVLLGIPFRESDGSRLAPFVKLLSVTPNNYDFSNVVIGDSGDFPFNRARSRNLIFQYAVDEGYDVVVCNDADSICQEEALRESIEDASLNEKINFPFNIVYELVPKGLNKIGLINWEQLKHSAFSKCYSEGGIWVATPDTWFAAGGMDPRFEAWGPEDRAFRSACRAILGNPVFHEGGLFCLHHSAERNWGPGVQLMMRYESNIENADGIQEIIYERSPYVNDYRTVSFEAEVSGPVIRSIPKHMLPTRYSTIDSGF